MVQLLQDTILGNTQWGIAIRDNSTIGIRDCKVNRHFPIGSTKYLSSHPPEQGGIFLEKGSSIAENEQNDFSNCRPPIWWADREVAAKETSRWRFNAPEKEEKPSEFDFLEGEYGPYEFTYPKIWLREKKEKEFIFLMLGPALGNWKAIDGYGWEGINPKTGALPNTLVAQTADTTSHQLSLEFIGATFRLPNGHWNPKGKVFSFSYQDSLQ